MMCDDHERMVQDLRETRGLAADLRVAVASIRTVKALGLALLPVALTIAMAVGAHSCKVSDESQRSDERHDARIEQNHIESAEHRAEQRRLREELVRQERAALTEARKNGEALTRIETGMNELRRRQDESNGSRQKRR